MVDGDEKDPPGGAVEGKRRAGPPVGGGLRHDDGPVVDPGVGGGLLGEPLGLVEAGADLRLICSKSRFSTSTMELVVFDRRA